MPILYNFHILLTTFYTIFGTNILIQCPVLVPVCCMFFVSQKIHIERSPNAIKTYGDFFWNICEFWEVESTREDARGAHEGEGRAQGRQVRPLPHGHLGHRLAWIFLPKNHIYSKKKSSSIFIPFGLPLIWIFYETKNMQQTGTGTGQWTNMLVPKIV